MTDVPVWGATSESASAFRWRNRLVTHRVRRATVDARRIFGMSDYDGDFDFGRGAHADRADYRSSFDGSEHRAYTDRSEHNFRDDHSTHSTHDGNIDHSFNNSFEADHSFNSTEINDTSHHDFL